MIIQSVQRVVELIKDSVVFHDYETIYDPISHKTFYECITYTHKGTLETFKDKGQDVDTKA